MWPFGPIAVWNHSLYLFSCFVFQKKNPCDWLMLKITIPFVFGILLKTSVTHTTLPIAKLLLSRTVAPWYLSLDHFIFSSLLSIATASGARKFRFEGKPLSIFQVREIGVLSTFPRIPFVTMLSRMTVVLKGPWIERFFFLSLQLCFAVPSNKAFLLLPHVEKGSELQQVSIVIFLKKYL